MIKTLSFVLTKKTRESNKPVCVLQEECLYASASQCFLLAIFLSNLFKVGKFNYKVKLIPPSHFWDIRYHLNATSLSLTLFHEWRVDSCNVWDARNPLLLASTRDLNFASDFLLRTQIFAQLTHKNAMTQVWGLWVWILETQLTQDSWDIEAVSWHLCSTEKMPRLNIGTR